MSKLNYPQRIYSLSDCHGGRAVFDPLESPDVSARLAEAIRSDLPTGVQHFDTFGAPARYYRHIVAEALRLHRENPESGSTGLFINSAPRTEEGNGQPFYRADFREGLTVVTTPLSVLSSVRDSITRLQYLPNKDNGLYPDREQHRSSYTPRLLAENHGLELQDADIDSIPEPEDVNILSYVDRFGNLALTEHSQVATGIRQRITGRFGYPLSLRIGHTTREITIGESLSTARPGSLVGYLNDGNFEVLGKWQPEWTAPERLEHSAYAQFGRPEIGSRWELSQAHLAAAVSAGSA